MKFKDLFVFIATAILYFFPFVVLANVSPVKQAFGMNVHLRERVPTADWGKTLATADTAGVQWAREQFNWDVIEPTDNTFDFTSYDAVVAAYEEHDIRVVGLLTYSSSWAASGGGVSSSGASDYEFYPPDLTAWQDYVATVAEHYAGRVDYWEIWNEPNHLAFWKGTAAQYAELLEAAASVITAANPEAKIVLGGLSGADADYLDQLYDQLADPTIIDIVAIHPYRVVNGNFVYAPEQTADGLNTLVTDIYNVLAVIKRHHQSGTPIWLTEIGWPTNDVGVSNKIQARYLQRAYAQALAIPTVRKVFWYALLDDSDSFGLVKEDYSKKKSYSAYQFMREQFSGKSWREQILPENHTIDDFSTNRGWQFNGTVCTDGTVKISEGKLQIFYQFTGQGNCYAPIALQQTLANRPYAIQFRAKGSNDDTVLRLRLTDATGEIFQYTLGYLPRQWLLYTVQLNQLSNHWGGDNDGVLDQPMTFNSFVLDNTDGSQVAGTVFIDDLFQDDLLGDTFFYQANEGKTTWYAYYNSTSFLKICRNDIFCTPLLSADR